MAFSDTTVPCTTEDWRTAPSSLSANAQVELVMCVGFSNYELQ
jgi:hypothetical protein